MNKQGDAMTEIEVPDWVVEVAAKAMADSIGHGMAEKCEKHAIAALTAALGAWVVPVGYQETTFHEQGAIYATSALWHWIPGKPIPENTADTIREPVYTLRQEKPE